MVQLPFVDLASFPFSSQVPQSNGEDRFELHDCCPNFCMCLWWCLGGWERRTREPLSETEGVSLLHLGMLCSSDRVVSPSVCECPFASTSALLVRPLVVRWLLYNVHSHIQYV